MACSIRYKNIFLDIFIVVVFLKVLSGAKKNTTQDIFFACDREGNLGLLKRKLNFATWWRHFSSQGIKIAFSTTKMAPPWCPRWRN